MIRQAGNTVKMFRATVDHLPGEPDVIFAKDTAASDTANLINHGLTPSCTDTVSYLGRRLSD